MSERVKCVICDQVVRRRVNASFRAPNKQRYSNNTCFPVNHSNPETGDNCHGFFTEGQKVEGDV